MWKLLISFHKNRYYVETSLESKVLSLEVTKSQTNIGSKKIMGPKKLGYTKKCRSRIFWVQQNSMSKKIWVRNKFWVPKISWKKLWVWKKFLVEGFFFCKKKSGPKKMLGPNFFFFDSEKIYGQKSFGLGKIVVPIKLLVQLWCLTMTRGGGGSLEPWGT